MSSESNPQAIAIDPPVAPWGKRNPFPAPLLLNTKLNKEGTHRDCRHLEISLEGSDFSYESGDAAATIPRNDPDLVDDILALLSFEADATVILKGGETLPLREALMENFDICTINKNSIKKWSAFSTHADIHAALEDEEKMSAILDSRHIIDLLVDFPADFKTPEEFASILRKLQPRLYSIASSPTAHGDALHLTVAKVEYETLGRQRKGVCSTFLCDRLQVGETVRLFLQNAKHFKLPEDKSTDIIMVGPGTGIAPFRSFLYERKATGSTGRHWLFFGNPHEATDYFYQEEFEALQEEGILNRLDLAWSRDQDFKIYVQDKINEAAEELWNWIDSGAHLYVCGDAVYMAGDVDKALHKSIEDHGGKSEEEAIEYVKQMKADKRYQRDVY